MTKPIISFRVPDGTDLDEWLSGRAGRMANPRINDQARGELNLWRAGMAAELWRIRFTLGEISCVADVLNGTLMDATISSSGLVYAGVVFEFRHATRISYGEKWDIDERELLDKLADVGPVADHALRDAIAAWRADHAPVTVEGFRQYGLNVVPNPPLTQEV